MLGALQRFITFSRRDFLYSRDLQHFKLIRIQWRRDRQVLESHTAMLRLPTN